MQNETFFFDFSKLGDLTGSGDLTLITNEQAVLESLYNLLMTQPGERVMEPKFGCDLNRYIFQPLSEYVAILIADEIELAIHRDEPRALDLNVEVDPNYDMLTYEVTISFSVTTSPERQTLQTTLNKIR